MNKKMRELLNALKDKEAQARTYLDAKDLVNAKVVKEEIQNLREEFEIEKELFEASKRDFTEPNTTVSDKEARALEVKVFAKAMAGKPITDEKEIKALSSLTDEDGKLLIPVDVQTRINEWMRDLPDMSRYVNVENVNTLSGSRVFEVEADAVPLEGVEEMVNIPKMSTPKFQQIKYSIQYFKGLIEIPNELIKNEQGGLIDYLARWIAKKIVATNNALIFYADGSSAQGILGTIGKIAHEELANKVTVKKLKSLKNKTLPTAIVNSDRCMWITNQSGFQLLDEYEESSGKPLMQPDITQPTVQRLLGKTVVVFPDNVLQNEDFGGVTKAPIIFGNPFEALTLFNRQATQIDTSSEAGFRNDSTATRVITGKDTRLIDTKALHVIYTPVE